jgi:hypothetical protein
LACKKIVDYRRCVGFCLVDFSIGPTSFPKSSRTTCTTTLKSDARSGVLLGDRILRYSPRDTIQQRYEGPCSDKSSWKSAPRMKIATLTSITSMRLPNLLRWLKRANSTWSACRS